MSRSLARRLTVLAAVGGCVAAAALPAFAQTPTASESVTVSVDAALGARQFRVLAATDNVDLERLDFASSRELPFRVLVHDQERALTGGFQVTAKMTNLYLKNAAGAAAPHDHATMIASKNLSLGYAANPLQASAVSTLVSPRISVSGTLKNCTDAAVREILGITNPLNLPVDELLSLLTGTADRVCDALAGATAPVSQVVDGPLQTVTPAVSQLLSVAELPVRLSGAQEGGGFTAPAYGGGIAPATAPAGAPPATTRQIMSGTPGVTAGLSAAVNSILESRLGAASPLTLLSLDQLLEGLRANPVLAPVVTALGDAGLTNAKRQQLLAGLTATLTDLAPTSVPHVTGDYYAYPVLKVNPVATKAGTYEGTMTVDFFDGLQ